LSKSRRRDSATHSDVYFYRRRPRLSAEKQRILCFFFEGKAVVDKDNPRSGFVEKGDSDKEGCFYDPWGRQYNVIIDANYDNMLDVDQIYQDSDWKANGRPHIGVGAFSMGKDNVIGGKKTLERTYREGQNISDDVISWQ